jgi:hypothetical protein
VICLFQLQLADAEPAAVEKRPASERDDVLKSHAAAQQAYQQAQTALTRHRQLTKARSLPIDLLRPIAEHAPAVLAPGGRSRQTAVGSGVGS